MTESDPISVARLFRERDSATTREVLERVRRILAYRGYGMPEEDRRELEQVVTAQIWNAVRRPGFEPAGFWGFVEVVVARRAIDWRRRHKTEIPLEDAGDFAAPGPGPLATLLEGERQELAEEVLARLPPSCRRLIELVAGEHKTYREAAAILGKAEGALRVRMHRCIGQARELLAERVAAKKKSDEL